MIWFVPMYLLLGIAVGVAVVFSLYWIGRLVEITDPQPNNDKTFGYYVSNGVAGAFVGGVVLGILGGIGYGVACALGLN